jgi:hypothetical protein
MQGKAIGNIIGDRYGRLIVVSEDGKGCRRRAICICDCGTRKSIRLDSLRSGAIVSCGCYSKEISKNVNFKHGACCDGGRSRLYQIWTGMKSRCFNSGNDSFDHYGGRGITICEEWLTFEVFKVWALANGYSDALTIERKNNNGNYEPTNCTWIHKADQRRNTTRVPGIIFRGERKTIRQWATFFRMSHTTLRCRLKRGWDMEKAITVPPKGHE